MNNIFNIDNPELIKNVYDLKGSKYKRETKTENIQKGAAKKDLNFIKEKMSIYVEKDIKEKLMVQFERDSEFLSQHAIIDYSLLLGVLDTDDIQTVKINNKELQVEDNSNNITYLNSKDSKKNYYLGIIDTLTSFGVRKTGEYITKRVFQGSTISCVPPRDYKERFVKFMDEIFTSEKSNDSTKF